jgi:membrane protein
MIHKMLKHDLVMISGSDANRLVPARSLDHITLREVLQVLRRHEGVVPSSLLGNSPVTALEARIESGLYAELGEQTVADWIRATAEQPLIAPDAAE